MEKNKPQKNILEGWRSFDPIHCSELRKHLHALYETYGDEDPSFMPKKIRELSSLAPSEISKPYWKASCLLLGDLADQGFTIGYDHKKIIMKPATLKPSYGESHESVKEKIRRSLRLGRNRQLKEESVRKFLRSMQRLRNFKGKSVSVLSLVDSGFDLADDMASFFRQPDKKRESLLGRLIKPVIELCEPKAKCSVTGLNLSDIWRYFRHTWSLEYRSIPGRSLPLLIRNAARPNKPIIGITMLASPTVRLTSRDKWIGWERESIQEKLESGERTGPEIAKLLLDTIKNCIRNIRVDDLIPAADLMDPNENQVFRLEQIADGAEHKRRREIKVSQNEIDSYETKESGRGVEQNLFFLKTASETNLFVKKRAGSLARLLGTLLTFNNVNLQNSPDDGLESLFNTKGGRKAIDVALAECRNNKISSQIADLSVCGAIAPYNEILGGKLVTLLMASKEVRNFYNNRYEDKISEISSKVAGRPIRRDSELLLLTTTSLYGMGSSQYNRLRLNKKDNPKLPISINWVELDKTAGYGCVHLSNETVDALKNLSFHTHGIKKVNNVFGEGASPRLRYIREGIDALGVDSNLILHHANPRIIYSCELLPDARDMLLGFKPQKIPRYIPTVQQITKSWIKRWLLNRTKREETLQRLCKLGPETIREDLWVDEEG